LDRWPLTRIVLAEPGVEAALARRVIVDATEATALLGSQIDRI
jgi:hypothetical protein